LNGGFDVGWDWKALGIFATLARAGDDAREDRQLHGQGSPLHLVFGQPSHAPTRISGMQGNWQSSPCLGLTPSAVSCSMKTARHKGRSELKVSQEQLLGILNFNETYGVLTKFLSARFSQSML
jgi:hypothetical protein